MSDACKQTRERQGGQEAGSARWAAFWERHHLAVATGLNALFLLAGLVVRWAGGPEGVAIALFLGAYVAGGFYSLRSGLAALREGDIDVDLLMVLAAVGAAILGSWPEGAVLLFLFSLSNTLQSYALDRTRNAIRALMQLRPTQALRKEGDRQVLVPLEALRLDDIVVVRPGERIPVDGVVVDGHSAVDQATITGESIPVEKGPGAEVFAGTINQNGVLEVRVTRLVGETVLARIIRMVEEAQSEQAPTQRLIDTVERYYAMGVIGMTVLAALVQPLFGIPWADAIYRALTLMVVASPCAVAMAVPAPVIAAIANGARHGVLFKGGMHLEKLATVEAVAFDKTGTLTEGRPTVADILPNTQDTPEQLLALVASLEQHSEHPLAQSLLRAARERQLTLVEPEGVQALPGRGLVGTVAGRSLWVGNRSLAMEQVGKLPAGLEAWIRQLEAEGKTVVFVGQEGRILGLITFIDALRPEAAATVAALKRLGIRRVVMLTGDNRQVGEALGRAAGVDEVRAELLPEEKVEAIRALANAAGEAEGGTRSGRSLSRGVAMVGDGVNDAPALATATVGIAMGAAGTDVAMETADVVLMNNDLRRLVHAFALAREARKVMWQNLIFALGVIAVLVVTVFVENLRLALGVMGHEGSTVLVILNGLRLLGFRGPRVPASVRQPALAPAGVAAVAAGTVAER